MGMAICKGQKLGDNATDTDNATDIDADIDNTIDTWIHISPILLFQYDEINLTDAFSALIYKWARW